MINQNGERLPNSTENLANGLYANDQKDKSQDVSLETINEKLSDVASLNKNTIALFGDSITEQNKLSSTNPFFHGVKGYFTWANVLLGHNFNVVKYSGVGGNTTAQMLARLYNDIINIQDKPRYCLVLGGTNDCLGDISSASIISNLNNIYDALIENGIIVIACTILPATTINGAPSRRNTMNAVNRWIKLLPQVKKNVIVCDWVPDFIDQSTGNPKSNFTTDGIHPTHLGAYYLGYKLYSILKDKIQISDILCNSAFDSSSYLGNPFMTGNVSGMATGYTAQATGGAVYTASKVASSDNLGDWQQIAVTTKGRVNVNKVTNVSGTFVEGDKVYLQMEFESDDNWDATSYISSNISCYSAGWASTLVAVLDLAWYPADGVYDFKNPRKGVLKTPIMTIPNGGVYLISMIDFNGIGTFRFRRMELLKA